MKHTKHMIASYLPSTMQYISIMLPNGIATNTTQMQETTQLQNIYNILIVILLRLSLLGLKS